MIPAREFPENEKNRTSSSPLRTTMNDQQKAGDTGAAKKIKKKSSTLLAASRARSAVNHALHNSSLDVRGTNGLPNTGPVASYENED